MYVGLYLCANAKTAQTGPGLVSRTKDYARPSFDALRVFIARLCVTSHSAFAENRSESFYLLYTTLRLVGAVSRETSAPFGFSLAFLF